MKVNFHNPLAAEAELIHTTRNGPFCTLEFRSEDGEVTLFLRDHQMNAARAIAAIFNGEIGALADRIAGVDIPGDDISLIPIAIACDLTGKDLNEALRERREAEDAA